MTLRASPFLLRAMTVADLAQIGEIESESFPSAWPASAYKRELQRNNLARYIVAARREPISAREPVGLSRVFANLRGMIGGELEAEPPQRLSGFIGVWFMVDEAHIVTVAVRESERRQGIGELLLLAAFDLAASRSLPVLTLECRVSNVAAQALYEKYGFERVGVRKRYYTDNNEDAVIMTTPSTVDAGYRDHIERLRRQHHERCGTPGIEHPEL